MSNWWLS